MGFKTGNIICMQGPFDVDLNLAMLRACRARYLVTKESGSAGGFDEKIRAAKLAGATALVIGRPLEYSDKTYSLDEIIRLFAFNDRANKHVYLTGMGCGAGTLTNEAVSVINRCDCIIGSRRMVDDLACIDKVDGLKDKKVFVSYDPEEIEGYLRENQPGDVAILYSGDIGFYSGAALLKDRLYGYEVIAVPGISSAVYLCDKVMIPWQDVCFLSCHGRSPDLKNAIGMHDKVLILLGREGDAGRICTELEVLGYGDLKVYIGQDLGSIGEKITSGRVSELKDIVSSSLSLMLIIKE
jgi:precorrin-6Y C5,15-methyltransferase (decarboxylating)